MTKEKTKGKTRDAKLTTWVFEPGHTEAEFKAKHMMVTWVRGLFKNIEGELLYNPDDPAEISLKTVIDAKSLWTGVQQRDDHLRSADFLDVENYPEIVFASKSSERTGATSYKVMGDMTIRGTTKEVQLDLHYIGSWKTPYWGDTGNQGFVTRVGFTGQTRLNRHDFKVDWNDDVGNGGIVVSHDIIISIDIQALLKSEMAALDSTK